MPATLNASFRHLVPPLLVVVLASACSSDVAPADASPAVDLGGVDVPTVVDTAPAPDLSPWLGCNNSGGERLDNGCFFEWRCPNGVDRKVQCTTGAGGFVCVCTNAGGTEEGRFSDAEACTRSAQEIATAANASCGWQLADGA